MDIDPVKYEVFLHRLWAIGEEGRQTLQRVTASPIVAQGGEVMSSFYDIEGKMVLACSGHLRFAGATSDAIKYLIEWYGKSPGFFDGDQIFFNDPYVAGSHTYDMMVVKPIFHRGELIAWTATSTHTADTGGLLRGAASEIFHEGIRILGVKVVEKGEFREDIFRTLTEQCRDPQYVGLDVKAMIAGNNVCGKRYLELVEKFGPEFLDAAGQKTIADSEEMARAKLRSLPDGQWVSRLYSTALNKQTNTAMPIQIVCTATKEGEHLKLDFAGSSPQMANDANSTLPSTFAHVGVALTNTLFWDVPWSDGKLAPVEVSVPEGTVLNCVFPAACGFAPWIGEKLVAAVVECMAKILYAAGRPEDVNASWNSMWAAGGPGYFPGGTNREGIRTAQGIYDIHGGGLGAAPHRDGVNTGGHMNIPSGGISDVERIEMQYPLLYFTRNHNMDGPGAGKYRGGLGSFRLTMVYGSQDFTNDYKPYGGIPQKAFGLFGGYPVGSGAFRAIFNPAEDVWERMKAGDYPTHPGPGGGGRLGRGTHSRGHSGAVGGAGVQPDVRLHRLRRRFRRSPGAGPATGGPGREDPRRVETDGRDGLRGGPRRRRALSGPGRHRREAPADTRRAPCGRNAAGAVGARQRRPRVAIVAPVPRVPGDRLGRVRRKGRPLHLVRLPLLRSGRELQEAQRAPGGGPGRAVGHEAPVRRGLPRPLPPVRVPRLRHAASGGCVLSGPRRRRRPHGHPRDR